MRLFAQINEEKPTKTILINESQVMTLLFEALDIEDIYKKYYSAIPQETFQKIVSADPTYNPDRPQKMGKFGKWLLSIFQKNMLKLEDLYKATEYLSTFIRFNKKIEQRDITKYNSLQDLYEVIKPFLENPQQAATKSEEVRQIKDGAEKVYEDSKWLVIVPHTKEASCYYGKGTQWCTAADNSYNYFDDYNSQGLLYINILKGTDTKYQFHFETDSFMDASDRRIQQPIAQTIGLTEELVNFYVEKYKQKAILPLKTDICMDDLLEVKDIENYYVNDEQTKLYKFNEETLDFELISDVTEEEYSFSAYTLQNRYIPMWQGDYYVNLFDTEWEELLFNESDNVSYIEIVKQDKNFIITHFNDSNVEYESTKGIFSLKDYRYTTTSLSESDNIIYLHDKPTYTYLKYKGMDLTCYSPDIVLIVNRDEEDYTKNTVIPFSLSMGRALSKEPYKGNVRMEIYYKGNSLYYQVLWKRKGRQNADALLFDGTLVPLPKFESESDQIIPQHLMKE